MKPHSEWDEEYILGLPSGESDTMEFKGAQALDFSLPGVDANKVLDELSRQLSAFANSGGGTIIYGLTNPKPGEALSVDKGGIPLKLKNPSTKEWLEDVIPGLVDFPLTKFSVFPILPKAHGSQIESGKALFLIHVPDSEFAPHMATKHHQYFARVGGKSRPIGHRLVSDISNRSKHPKLRLDFMFFPRPNGVFGLEAICENEGRILANYVNGMLYLPTAIDPFWERPAEAVPTINGIILPFKNIHKDVVGNSPGFAAPLHSTRFDPVLPKCWFVVELGIVVSPESMQLIKEEVINYNIFADSAPAVDASIKIKDIRFSKAPMH